MLKRLFKLIIRLLLILLLLAVIAAGVLFYLVKFQGFDLNSRLVRQSDIRGVDISSYQVDVDMAELKSQGIQFIYIKATEGSAHQDEYFSQNWGRAAAASLPAGAYHFFSFDSPGATQAQNFISVVGPSLEGRLLPVLDVELSGDYKEHPPETADVVREVRAFSDAIQQQYGVKPMLYAQWDVYLRYLRSDFGDYPRWVRSVYWPVWLEAGNDWLVWQYSGRGQLQGYSGGESLIDLNVVNRRFGLDALRV